MNAPIPAADKGRTARTAEPTRGLVALSTASEPCQQQPCSQQPSTAAALCSSMAAQLCTAPRGCATRGESAEPRWASLTR
eukprot:2842322-Prymnesium_polylepis.1